MQRGSASRIQLVIMSSGCVSIIVLGQIFMKSDLVTKKPVRFHHSFSVSHPSLLACLLVGQLHHGDRLEVIVWASKTTSDLRRPAPQQHRWLSGGEQRASRSGQTAAKESFCLCVFFLLLIPAFFLSPSCFFSQHF